MSPASGSSAATTSMATPGASSASREILKRGARHRSRGMNEAPAPSERIVWEDAGASWVVDQPHGVKGFFLKPPQWRGFIAGQHVDVRLTAPDGYHAERSYSIA